MCIVVFYRGGGIIVELEGVIDFERDKSFIL